MPEAYDEAIRRRLALITEMGTSANAYQQQALATRQSAQSFASAGNYGGGGGGGLSIPRGGKGNNFNSFLNAIVGQESGGNYRAINPHSGASGRYQIMPGNIPSWSKEALGRSVSVQQFRSNPKLQDQIAQYKLRQYYNKYGAAGAAVAWYAGPGNAAKYVRNPNGWNRRQGNYPSINSYVLQILKRMGLR